MVLQSEPSDTINRNRTETLSKLNCYWFEITFPHLVKFFKENVFIKSCLATELGRPFILIHVELYEGIAHFIFRYNRQFAGRFDLVLYCGTIRSDFSERRNGQFWGKNFRNNTSPVAKVDISPFIFIICLNVQSIEYRFCHRVFACYP